MDQFSQQKNPAVAAEAVVCLEEECLHYLQNHYKLQEQDQLQVEEVHQNQHHPHHLIHLQEEHHHYLEDNQLLLQVVLDLLLQVVDQDLHHQQAVLVLPLFHLLQQVDLDHQQLLHHPQQAQEVAIQKMVGHSILLMNFLHLLVLVDQQRVFQVVEMADF